MNKIFYILTLFLALSCEKRQTHETETIKLQSAIEENIQPIIQFAGESDSIYTLEQRMKDLKVAGVSISVAKGKNVIFSGTYGYSDKESKEILTPETVMSCCSVSKVITITRILQLVEDGQLDLDEDVNSYLSNWKVPDNELTETEKVTIRRLMEHHSGINARGGTEFRKNESIPTVMELLTGINTETAPVEVVKIPGTEYEYSANNYLILQQLINEIDGSFEQSISQNIFEPLGMETSTYLNPFYSEGKYNFATGYTDDGLPIPEKWTIKPDHAAAGLWTNSRDLIKLISELQFSLQNNTDGILSAETMKKFDFNTTYQHNLGFNSDKYTFGHPGGCTGFSAMVLAWKNEPYSLAITMNSMSGKLRNEIIYSIAKSLELPTDFFKPKVLQVINLSDESLNKYIGSYEPVTEKEVGLFKVEKIGGGLQFHFSKLETPTIIRALNDSVFVDESGYEHKFKIADNKVIGFTAWDFFETSKIEKYLNDNSSKD